MLGGVLIALGVPSDGAYALAGGWLGGRLRRSERVRRRQEVAAGVTYVDLGAVTALSGSHSS